MFENECASFHRKCTLRSYQANLDAGLSILRDDHEISYRDDENVQFCTIAAWSDIPNHSNTFA